MAPITNFSTIFNGNNHFYYRFFSAIAAHTLFIYVDHVLSIFLFSYDEITDMEPEPWNGDTILIYLFASTAHNLYRKFGLSKVLARYDSVRSPFSPVPIELSIKLIIMCEFVCWFCDHFSFAIFSTWTQIICPAIENWSEKT